MADDYYSILGIDQTADTQDVKRAYFRLVRKYSPERQPEQFQKIRAAYEVLNDPQARAQYDRIVSFPPEAAYLYRTAEQALAKNDFDRAAAIYKEILTLYPDLAVIEAALAKAYESAGKTGKAVATWERLCRIEPNNPAYAAALGNSYAERGWRKKAITQYENAIALDGDDAELWMTFLGCHMKGQEYSEAKDVVQRALVRSKERNFESIRLYLAALFLSLEEGYLEDSASVMEPYLRDILRLLKLNAEENEKLEIEHVLLMLLKVLKEESLRSLFPVLEEIAALAGDSSGLLQESLTQARLKERASSLEDEGFSPLIADMAEALTNGCGCDKCRLEMLTMEGNLLWEVQDYRREILRLKTEFPDLYALHSAFFNEALLGKNLEKMLTKREKEIKKLEKMRPDIFEDGEEDMDYMSASEPVRRTEPKIGRNDPCPCGSGKKYKKCCGA